jgi:hypothetical protein
MKCGKAWAAGLIAMMSVGSGALAAAELDAGAKRRFVESICAGFDRSESCLSAGRLVERLSLDWIIFEACQASGSAAIMAKCFDRASLLAGELTGEPRFEKNYRHCHRFEGELVENYVVLCYIANFKYASHKRMLPEQFEIRSGR